MKDISRNLWLSSLLLFVVVILTMAWVVFTYLTLPKIDYAQSCIKAKNSLKLMCSMNPSYVKLDGISKFLKDSILVSEDIGFYNHEGFDWGEIRQSFFTNLKRFRFARGGSTISQQTVKNVFLSPEKTISRKIREAFITFEMESKLNKDKIFEFYLNTVEFGPNIYGVYEASRYYFNIDPIDLNIAQSAFLAFLLPNPQKYRSSFSTGVLSEFARTRLEDIIYKLEFYKKITFAEKQHALSSLGSFPWSHDVQGPIDSILDIEDGESTSEPQSNM